MAGLGSIGWRWQARKGEKALVGDGRVTALGELQFLWDLLPPDGLPLPQWLPSLCRLQQLCAACPQHLNRTKTQTIDHSTTQRKLCPFLGVWQATRKDDAAECKSTLDLLLEDLSLSCFGEGKLTQRSVTQRSKRQGYQFFCVCDAVFLVSFLLCRTPPPDHMHESLPDHFRPCLQNTWAPYYTTARDWLKPKGVSALTDRSGVVYCGGFSP